MAEIETKADDALDAKTKEAVQALDDVTDPESTEKKYPYPKSIAFIVSNELCERFSFYGMRTILIIFLTNKLLFSEDNATVVFHVFIMLVYFFPVFGAIIADSWLGKFKTIIYLSIVYAIGCLLIGVTAIPTLNFPLVAFTMISLALIAIGSGGIKPNVSSFGGDQFIIPGQERQLETFFSLFYFSINTGSLLSTFISPILREDVHCFGDDDCFSLAFGVPGVLMVLSIIFFIVGKRLYIIKDPAGNIIVDVSKCISHAISRKFKAKKTEKREHWLDYADDKYDTKLISDIKAVIKVLILFIPLPIFWALFDQQGSRWTLQATKMNGALGEFNLKPDQMQVVNPLLILLFIPLFEVAIYPALKWCKIIRKPLHKMILGGTLAGLAFIASGLVELQLEKTYVPSPGVDEVQLRFYNGYQCDLNIQTNFDQGNFVLKQLDMYENLALKLNNSMTYRYKISKLENKDCDALTNDLEGAMELTDRSIKSYFISDKMIPFIDSVDKSNTGKAFVRVLKKVTDPSRDGNVRFVISSETIYTIPKDSLDRIEIKPNQNYDIYVGNELVSKDVSFETGGGYTYVVNMEVDKTPKSKNLLIVPVGAVHMLWLLPQYIIITMGEVMFSVTGLEFSFTQAPVSMKAVLTSAWLLTVAIGNLIVVLITEIRIFKDQADEFFLFAGLMIADMLIFAIMAYFYKYVDATNGTNDADDKLALEQMKRGNQNGEENKIHLAEEAAIPSL